MNGKQYVTVITGAVGQGAGMQTIADAPYRTGYRLLRRVLTFTLDGQDTLDRKSVVKGNSVSVRVDLGGRRIIKKKQQYCISKYTSTPPPTHSQLHHLYSTST